MTVIWFLHTRDTVSLYLRRLSKDGMNMDTDRAKGIHSSASTALEWIFRLIGLGGKAATTTELHGHMHGIMVTMSQEEGRRVLKRLQLGTLTKECAALITELAVRVNLDPQEIGFSIGQVRYMELVN